MVSIVRRKAGDPIPYYPRDWVMVGQLVGKGAKAWGLNLHGGYLHPADGERWDSGWLSSFDEAMLRAREWADQQGIETIYVNYELLTQEEHDAAMKAAIDRILRR